MNKILKETFLYSHTPFSSDVMARGGKKRKKPDENATISAPHKSKGNFFTFAISFSCILLIQKSIAIMCIYFTIVLIKILT